MIVDNVVLTSFLHIFAVHVFMQGLLGILLHTTVVSHFLLKTVTMTPIVAAALQLTKVVGGIKLAINLI